MEELDTMQACRCTTAQFASLLVILQVMKLLQKASDARDVRKVCVCLIVCLTHCVHVPVSFPDCHGMGMGLVSIAVILYM